MAVPYQTRRDPRWNLPRWAEEARGLPSRGPAWEEAERKKRQWAKRPTVKAAPSRGAAWEEAERKKRQWAKDHYSPISNEPVAPGGGGGAGGGGGGLPPTPSQHVDTTGTPPKPPGAKTFGGGGGGVSPELQALRDKARAEDLVEMQFDPAENQLHRLMQQIGLSRDRDVQTQERYGELQGNRLEQIYNALSEQLGESKGRIGELYSGAQEGAREAYGKASETAGEAASQVEGLLQGTANKLGLGAALKDPLARLEGQLANIQAENEQSAAGATSELGNIGADLQALVEYDMQNADKESAQQRANLGNIVADNIGQIQTMANEAIYGHMGQLADISLQRGAALRDAYKEVVDARTEKERQARLDQLAEEIQRNTMMLQNKQLGLQTEESLFNRQMSQAEFDLKKQQLEAQMAAANSPEERMRAQLELEKLMAETDLIRARADAAQAGGAVGGMQYKGQEGVMQYASNQLGDPAAGQLAMQRYIQPALGSGMNNAPGAALRMIQNDPNLSPQQKQEMVTLVNVYFGNYSSYKNE